MLDICRPCVLAKVHECMPRSNYETPNVICPYVLPKFHADMPCHTSSNRVCFRRAIITCHARHRLILYLSKDDDAMPRSKSFDRVYIPRAMMALPRPTSSNRVYCPMAMMVCQARCCLMVFIYPRAMMACHARYCLILFCYPRAMMAYHAQRSPIVCAVKR